MDKSKKLSEYSVKAGCSLHMVVSAAIGGSPSVGSKLASAGTPSSPSQTAAGAPAIETGNVSHALFRRLGTGFWNNWLETVLRCAQVMVIQRNHSTERTVLNAMYPNGRCMRFAAAPLSCVRFFRGLEVDL